MALVIIAVIALVLGFVIAAGVIGRESRRLGSTRREPVWRLEEAASFVESELDYDIAARLEPDALRSVLRWHLNALQYEREQGSAMVAADEASVADLYRRARNESYEISRPEVQAVVGGHLAYLERIGAIGRADG